MVDFDNLDAVSGARIRVRVHERPEEPGRILHRASAPVVGWPRSEGAAEQLRCEQVLFRNLLTRNFRVSEIFCDALSEGWIDDDSAPFAGFNATLGRSLEDGLAEVNVDVGACKTYPYQ